MQLNLSNIEYAYPAAVEPALSGVTAPFKYLRRPAVVYRRDEGVVAAAAVPGVGVQAGVAERPREFPRGASYGEHEGARS